MLFSYRYNEILFHFTVFIYFRHSSSNNNDDNNNNNDNNNDNDKEEEIEIKNLVPKVW